MNKAWCQKSATLICKIRRCSKNPAHKQESDFYKDKSRQLEIQLTQAVGNERILNENIRAMEDRNIQLQNEVARLKESGSRAYEELARESQQLQLQLNEIAGRRNGRCKTT